MLASELLKRLTALPAGSLAAGWVTTGLIDLKTPVAGVDFIDPATGLPVKLPGYYFVAQNARWLFGVGDVDGTITTGPTLRAGNNVARTNLLALGVQISAASLNTVIAAGGPPVLIAAALGVNNLALPPIDAGTPFKLDVTIGATLNTATKLSGRLLVGGQWVPVAP